MIDDVVEEAGVEACGHWAGEDPEARVASDHGS